MTLADAIVQAHSGKDAGFSELFTQTAEKVWLSAGLLGCAQPEQALICIYSQAFAAIASLRSPSDLRVWLGSITYDVLLRSPEYTPFQPHLSGEQQAGYAFLCELPREERTAVLLLCSDGCSAAQAADILRIPEIEVKRAMRRARQTLTQRMKQSGSTQTCNTGWLMELLAAARAALPEHAQTMQNILDCIRSGEPWDLPEPENLEECEPTGEQPPIEEPEDERELVLDLVLDAEQTLARHNERTVSVPEPVKNPLVQNVMTEQPEQPDFSRMNANEKGGFLRKLFRNRR